MSHLSNAGSIVGWGLLIAVPTGAFFGLIGEALYLIILFPTIMGRIVAIGAQKGVQIARLPRNGLVMISIVLSVSTYASMLFVDYQFFRSEVAATVAMRQLTEQGKSMEEIREFKKTQRYGELRSTILKNVSTTLASETGYSGFVGYLILVVRNGQEIGLVISNRAVNLGSTGTVILWILEMVIIAVVIGRQLAKRCSVF